MSTSTRRAWLVWGVVLAVYLLAIFNRFDRTVEEASLSLGVSPAQTFRRVTFPIIFPGVLSAMLFSFTLSYDEFSRTLFTAGRELTLPLSIYGTFIPKVNNKLNNGNVAFFFGRYEF